MELDRVYCGDALQVLRSWPDQCVDMVVTSPPYYALRDYGVVGQLGLESTPEKYVDRLVEIFREIRRVLKDHGTVWLNIGDTYASTAPGTYNTVDQYVGKGTGDNRANYRPITGCKPKDLLMIPAQVALALRADGWYLRQDIIWEKPNPMPESVTDRCTKSHEYIFLLSKCQHYYYDAEAIKEPVTDSTVVRLSEPNLENQYGTDRVPGKTNGPFKPAGNKVSRNRRSVWQITTKPYKEAHFATFPPELPETCILAGSSAKGVCPKCGKPWKRVVEKESHSTPVEERKGRQSHNGTPPQQSGWFWKAPDIISQHWEPTCNCWEYAKDLPIIDGVGFKQPYEPVPAVILDPFMGSGTVASVALALKRHFLGIELNPKYIQLCEKRIRNTVVPLFVDA